MTNFNSRINYDYLKITKEIPLLINLNMLPKKKKGRNKIKKDILIINCSLIGDFLISLPALTQFLSNLNIKADLVVSPILKDLAKHLKYANNVYTLPSLYQREIEKGDIDNQINGHYKQVIVIRTSKNVSSLIQSISYDNLAYYFGDYFRYGVSLAKSLSKKEGVWQWEDVNYNFLGVKKENILFFDDIFDFNDKEKVESTRYVSDNKVIVIHTGSGWFVKLWSNNKWVNLLKKINKNSNYNFIFLGGTEKEKKDYAYISKKLPFNTKSIIGMNLEKVAPIMRQCDYFLGVDSGPRHIAHLLNMPSIILLGPGPKNFSPQDRNAAYIDKSDCWCTNLFCYRKKPCVNKITVKEVYSEWIRLS